MVDQDLCPLGINLVDDSSLAQTETSRNIEPRPVKPAPNLDYFIERDGERFAGTHLIIDLGGASHLDSISEIEAAFHDSIKAAGATLLHMHFHHFTPNGGVSGVAVLAESHISIHTWPEADYAALDVFMCGDAKPHAVIDVLKRAFSPEKITVQELRRGRNLV